MDAQLAVNQWLRHLGFDSLYSHNDQYRHTGRSDIPDSFSGRTCDSDSHYGGSIPSSGAKAVESLQPRKRIYGQAAQAVRECLGNQSFRISTPRQGTPAMDITCQINVADRMTSGR